MKMNSWATISSSLRIFCFPAAYKKKNKFKKKHLNLKKNLDTKLKSVNWSDNWRIGQSFTKNLSAPYNKRFDLCLETGKG